MSKNYYETLGLSKNASKDEIKKAFRTLAHQYHPDKKGGDEQKFKEVNEAYSVLSDDKKRAEYDAYGRVFSGGAGAGNAGFDPSGFGGFEGFDFSNFGFGGDADGGFDFGVGEIFGDIFGGRATRSKRGRDISIDIELSFAESIFGSERRILLRKSVVCDYCNGSGGEPGTPEKTCTACNGKGKLRETKRSFIGSFSTVRNCDECGGTGKIPERKCSVCAGTGVVRKEKEIAIKIPSGIEDGEMIRLSGEGEMASKGVSGDLYVKVHVKKHPSIRKEGPNLLMDLPIKLSSALLGDEYTVATLDGDIKVTIPEGIRHGEILRVRGKGVPIERVKRGDLLIRIQIDLPAKLSREAKHLIEQLKKEGI
ncbi:MAG: molecular chaperone DnaJ [Candidatus Taylorbacteria bacterium]|nr:molecular chaperone DnaJ [Candidatus Taylorbacteria bacterium]